MYQELPLEEMSVTEKLQILETIWNSLQSKPDEVPVPVWHRDVLDARIARVESGDSRFTDWNVAKERIRTTCK